MTNVLKITVLIFLSVCNVRSAKILCVFNLPSVSHQVVFQPIWKELSIRGHEVTVITPNPLKDPELTNLNEIDLSYFYDRNKQASRSISMGQTHWHLTKMLFEFIPSMAETLFTQQPVQSLINDTSAEFDVVLAEYAIPFTGIFATRFKCPLIAVSSLGVGIPTYDALANPIHPILNPDFTMTIGSDTFLERVEAVVFAIWQRYYYYYVTQPKLDVVIKKYFGSNTPYIGDVEGNVSLIFQNTNPVIHRARPNLPSIIEIGRMHIKPKKPLPQVSFCKFVF